MAKRAALSFLSSITRDNTSISLHGKEPKLTRSVIKLSRLAPAIMIILMSAQTVYADKHTQLNASTAQASIGYDVHIPSSPSLKMQLRELSTGVIRNLSGSGESYVTQQARDNSFIKCKQNGRWEMDRSALDRAYTGKEQVDGFNINQSELAKSLVNINKLIGHQSAVVYQADYEYMRSYMNLRYKRSSQNDRWVDSRQFGHFAAEAFAAMRLVDRDPSALMHFNKLSDARLINHITGSVGMDSSKVFRYIKDNQPTNVLKLSINDQMDRAISVAEKTVPDMKVYLAQMPVSRIFQDAFLKAGDGNTLSDSDYKSRDMLKASTLADELNSAVRRLSLDGSGPGAQKVAQQMNRAVQQVSSLVNSKIEVKESQNPKEKILSLY